MAELLTRVMALPLAPLHKTIATLQAQFTNAQREGANVTLQMQTSLDAMRQRQDTQMNRLVEIATDARSASEGLEDLDDLLTERHDAQAARDQYVQDQLAGLHTKAVAAEQSTARLVAQMAAELRTQLKTQSADHADRLAVATHAITRIDTGLDELRTRIDAVAPALAPRFDTLTATVQEASSDSARQATAHMTRVNTGLGELRACVDAVAPALSPRFDTLAATVQEASIDSVRQMTTQLKTQSADHTGRLAAATQTISRIDTGLGELRVGIDAVAPALAPSFDTLAATVQEASSDSARHYHSLSESQKAVVAAAVHEQLAPFKAKSRFLLAFSALSCASTVALLCLHFIH